MKYIYMGVFKNGKLIEQIGNKIPLAEGKGFDIQINLFNDLCGVVCKLMTNYTLKNNEYFGFDYDGRI